MKTVIKHTLYIQNVSFLKLLSLEPYQFCIHHIYWGFYGTMVDELKVWPGGGID